MLKSQNVITVGVNRVTVASALCSRDYFPDILFVWDNRTDTPKGRDIAKVFEEAAGRSWRVAVQQTRGEHYPHDQLIPRNPSCNGGGIGKYRDGDIAKDGCAVTNSAGDAAINLLWRMGVRKIYIAGIDGYGGYCQWGQFPFEDRPEESHWTPNERREATWEKWKSIVESYGDELRMYNVNINAVMVKSGLMPFGIPGAVAC
jgi:hypothetical protein